MRTTNDERKGDVLVVGAGISGMQSALLLAEAGRRVFLLDSAPGIGGAMHLLDLTFPTNSCGLCLMLPGRAAYCPTIECDLHRNIRILPYAEVLAVEGEPGNLTAQVRSKPRYVDVEKCTNCGLCAEVCPVERPDRYEGRLKPGKAIYAPPSRAIPSAYVVDMDYCTRCGRCVEVCPTGAIDLAMEGETFALEVGAIILSPGFEPFDASLKGEYGFGHYDNVLTSLQFERMVSFSGSTGGRIVRPSDGKPPRRIAFIQCVGSRDDSIGRGYCSSVCCMYTAKQVEVAKKLQPDLDVTVFFMDIRAHGKDFDEYFDAVESLSGVRYRRCMVSAVHQHQTTRDLRLGYVAEDGSFQEEDFDLVVLAVGFEPGAGTRELGASLGVELNRYGFGVTSTFAPTESSRPGVVISGAFREPKDIPETVVEASAAAAQAARLLGTPGAPAPVRQPDEVRDVALDWPRVGVFLCDCRGEVGGVVDLAAVAEQVEGLQDVVLVRTLDNACLASGREQIGAAIAEYELNRVVLAGCAARQYEAAFTKMMRGAGLDEGLLERVNLRGEVAWVHGDGDGAVATAKARELVAAGVASARLRKALPAAAPWRVTPRALVIGGGLAGLTAATSLAEMGFEVDVVERSAELGGQLRELRFVLGGLSNGDLVWDDPQPFLDRLVEQAEGDERIHIYREAQVAEVSGLVGRFHTRVRLADGGEEVLHHGAIIVATGGHEVTPTEYLYGQDERVLTQREFEQRLAAGAELPSAVVMIQCVGSREPGRPYCSRICCTKAVTNALKVKEAHPEVNVFVLYREMRTYGFREDYYREARRRGVVFLRYELDAKPQVEADGEGLTVRVREPITGEEVALRAGLVVLSTGIDPNESQDVAEMLGVPLDKNGFFREEYPKMRPLDFTRRGIFVCGLAHSPRSSDETIVQAQGAAMRAAEVLSKPALEVRATVATVNIKRCSACGVCVEVCPFGARVLEPGATYAQVIEVLCQGCGACVAACPNKASGQRVIDVGQVYGMLDAVAG